MDRNNLSKWLATLDPLKDWDLDNLEVLEKQIIRVVREGGYLNLPLLLELSNGEYFI